MIQSRATGGKQSKRAYRNAWREVNNGQSSCPLRSFQITKSNVFSRTRLSDSVSAPDSNPSNLESQAQRLSEPQNEAFWFPSQMDESYAGLPTSHLLGSVPAVTEDKEKGTTSYEETFEQQPANNWRGVFNIASYTQYFNVDTDVVLNRMLSSLYPHNGDFFSKIDANPDLYGLVWISTTLVFVLAALGNCATYLMDKRTDSSTAWDFNVSYMNMAAFSVYGYAILVPLAFYFLIQYMGTSNASLVRFWCMWGYSLFIFIAASFLLLIPVEALRWIIILLVGGYSACFVAFNLRSNMEGNELSVVVIAAFLLQLALAIFFKVYFFP